MQRKIYQQNQEPSLAQYVECGIHESRLHTNLNLTHNTNKITL